MTTKSLNWNSIGFLFCLSALAVAYAFIASSPANAQADDLDAPAVIGAPIALGFADGTSPPPPRRGRFSDEGQQPPRFGREMMQEARERNPELFEQARERIANGEHPRDVMPEIMRKFRQDASDEDLAWMRENRAHFRGVMQQRGRNFQDDAPRGPRRLAMADRGVDEGRRGPGPREFERGPRREMRGALPPVIECPHCHRAIDRPGEGPQGRRGFGPMNERGRGFQDDAPRGPRGPMMEERGFGEGRRGEGPQGHRGFGPMNERGRGFQDDAPRGPRGPMMEERGFGEGRRGEGPRGMGPRDFERGPRGPRFGAEGAGPAVAVKDIEAIIDRLERRLQDLREQTKE